MTKADFFLNFFPNRELSYCQKCSGFNFKRIKKYNRPFTLLEHRIKFIFNFKKCLNSNILKKKKSSKSVCFYVFSITTS